MITYFSMEGFLSVKKKVELYFVPKPHTRITNTRFEDNFIHTPKYKLMKAAVLFGMNASGKSNVLLGMEHLISMINRGLNLGAVDDMRRNLINFDCKTVAFEIGLYDVKSDQDYVYQIAYDCEKIVSEKLVLNGQEIFSFSGGKLSVTNLSGIKERDALIRLFSGVSTELYLLKLKDYMGEYITSFQKLAAAVKTNIRDIVPMLDRDDIRVVKEERKGFWENNKKRILSVFHMLDGTITDIGFEKIRADGYEVLIFRGKKKYHLGIESKGIQKICHLMDVLITNMINGEVLAVDELDSSISTGSLIELFNDLINTKENKGQFIITSHNPFLMNQNIFHPQQLYIVNKKSDLSSEIYSFDDFDLRNDKNKLYEDYLKGRFGGAGE